MKINEFRAYPYRDYRLVNMDYHGKTYAYSIVNGTEQFEVYFNKKGDPSLGHYTSRVYRLDLDIVPLKYQTILNFLIEEFNKADWDTIEVTNELSKQ